MSGSSRGGRRRMPTSLIHAESVARLSKKKPSHEHQRRLCMPCRAEDREDEDREEAKYAVNSVGGPGGKNFSCVLACQRPEPPFASRCQVQPIPAFLIDRRGWGGRVLMVSPVPPSPVPVVSSESRWPAILRILGLVGVISLLWCKHYGMWTLDAWRVPLDYSGDSFEILTRIELAIVLSRDRQQQRSSHHDR